MSNDFLPPLAAQDTKLEKSRLAVRSLPSPEPQRHGGTEVLTFHQKITQREAPLISLAPTRSPYIFGAVTRIQGRSSSQKIQKTRPAVVEDSIVPGAAHKHLIADY